jgi:hypothetical protein
MFGPWQSFYQMTGEAAATLTGLLFIVSTLASGRPAASAMRGVALFTSPTFFNLASVVAISALALTPDGEGRSSAAIIFTWAALGFVYTGDRMIRIHAIPDPSHWSDRWCYGVWPTLAFLALAVSAAAAWAGVGHAPYVLALSLLALLLAAIRNAWDLVTWLALRRGQSGSPEP